MPEKDTPGDEETQLAHERLLLFPALHQILGLTIWVERKLWLRDTGRKLKHLDQEIHSGQNELSAEILERFGEE